MKKSLEKEVNFRNEQMSLTFDIISDLHLDFHLKQNANEKKYDAFCKNKLFDEGFEHGEILLIAGDLSHYNNQTKAFFEYLVKKYYKELFFVTGNHDMYLINKKQEKKYKNSQARLTELKEMFKDNEKIHYLDGDIVGFHKDGYSINTPEISKEDALSKIGDKKFKNIDELLEFL